MSRDECDVASPRALAACDRAAPLRGQAVRRRGHVGAGRVRGPRRSLPADWRVAPSGLSGGARVPPAVEEAPVHASEHPLVRELVPSVRASDGRQADVFVQGLSLGRGLPVVGDMCMGSAMHADGTPYPGAANLDGRAIGRLTEQKHNKYPELVTSDRLHYVVLAV